MVDLTDNYADEEDIARSSLHRRAESRVAEPSRQETRPIRTERWPGYFNLAHDTQRPFSTDVQAASRLPEPAVTRSWDRRTPAASGEMHIDVKKNFEVKI